jgi:hypothetical protein
VETLTTSWWARQSGDLSTCIGGRDRLPMACRIYVDTRQATLSCALGTYAPCGESLPSLMLTRERPTASTHGLIEWEKDGTEV